MSLTRAGLENELVDRLGPRLSYVGMATTTAGINSSLNGPIRRALKAMGFPTADPLTVTDTDLAAFLPVDSGTPDRDAWRVERLCDLATLQALKSILWKTTDVDWQAGQDRVMLSQFVTAVREDIAQLEADVSQPYGPDLPAASLGSMTPDPCHLPNDPFDPCRTRSPWGRWPYPE